MTPQKNSGNEYDFNDLYMEFDSEILNNVLDWSGIDAIPPKLPNIKINHQLRSFEVVNNVFNFGIHTLVSNTSVLIQQFHLEIEQRVLLIENLLSRFRLSRWEFTRGTYDGVEYGNSPFKEFLAGGFSYISFSEAFKNILGREIKTNFLSPVSKSSFGKCFSGVGLSIVFKNELPRVLPELSANIKDNLHGITTWHGNTLNGYYPVTRDWNLEHFQLNLTQTLDFYEPVLASREIINWTIYIFDNEKLTLEKKSDQSIDGRGFSAESYKDYLKWRTL